MNNEVNVSDEINTHQLPYNSDDEGAINKQQISGSLGSLR